MPQHSGRVVLLILLLGWGGAEPGWAQGEVSGAETGARDFCQREPRDRNGDVRGLAVVYCTSSPVVSGALRGAHATARPTFFGAIPAAWLRAGLLRSREAAAEAYLLSVSQGLTYGMILGVKHTVDRPRPYVRQPLESRTDRYGSVEGKGAFVSFPSGHAGLSATLATSWSLSHPQWYVIGPGAAWATAVGLSRLYLGVHYPSDVFAGTLLGVGMAVLIHHFQPLLTPSFLEASHQDRESLAVPITVRLRF